MFPERATICCMYCNSLGQTVWLTSLTDRGENARSHEVHRPPRSALVAVKVLLVPLGLPFAVRVSYLLSTPARYYGIFLDTHSRTDLAARKGSRPSDSPSQ